MFKERDLDSETIDAYHSYIQRGIRKNLNSISLGPGKLPYRTAVCLVVFGFCFLLIGILLVALRKRHVYLWDWDAQFLGPFFVILFLICMSSATYLFVLAKRRSNHYRSQLYFRPIGDWGANCVHKSELAREEEMKHDLKSGTTPHKNVKPRSEAYSQSSRPPRSGRDNRAYDKSPLDGQGRPIHDEHRRGPPPDGHRGPPPDGRRGPPPDGRRGPPPDDRRGPPPGDRRGPPPGDRRGPPPGDRRGPPPGDRRGPHPDDRRGPPPDGRSRGPPPGDRPRHPDDRPRHPDDRPRHPDDRPRHPDDRPRHPDDRPRHPDDRPRQGSRSSPPPEYREARRPPPGPRSPPPNDRDDRRPVRSAPRFGDVEVIPAHERRDYKLILNKSKDESDI